MGDCSPAVSVTLYIVEVAVFEPALMVRIANVVISLDPCLLLLEVG